MMKRSPSLTLALMAGTAITVSACGDEDKKKEEVVLYPTKQACLDAGTLPAEACEEAFRNALALHQETAPRFDDPALCEEQFGVGQCEPRQVGGDSFWGPFFAGYIVSRVAEGIGDMMRSRPIYRGRDGYAYTPGGAPVTRTGSGTLGVDKDALAKPPAPAKVSTRTSTVSRGGFGGSLGGGFGGSLGG